MIQMSPAERSEARYDEAVLKRAAIAVLGLAVLSAAGMPLRLPCCSLRKLEATAIQSDCCPIPGCTLAERQGAAPAAVRAASNIADASRLLAGESVRSNLPARVPAPSPIASLSPSPPSGRSPTPALLSVYRI